MHINTQRHTHTHTHRYTYALPLTNEFTVVITFTALIIIDCRPFHKAETTGDGLLTGWTHTHTNTHTHTHTHCDP